MNVLRFLRNSLHPGPSHFDTVNGDRGAQANFLTDRRTTKTTDDPYAAMKHVRSIPRFCNDAKTCPDRLSVTGRPLKFDGDKVILVLSQRIAKQRVMELVTGAVGLGFQRERESRGVVGKHPGGRRWGEYPIRSPLLFCGWSRRQH